MIKLWFTKVDPNPFSRLVEETTSDPWAKLYRTSLGDKFIEAAHILGGSTLDEDRHQLGVIDYCTLLIPYTIESLARIAMKAAQSRGIDTISNPLRCALFILYVAAGSIWFIFLLTRQASALLGALILLPIILPIHLLYLKKFEAFKDGFNLTLYDIDSEKRVVQGGTLSDQYGYNSCINIRTPTMITFLGSGDSLGPNDFNNVKEDCQLLARSLLRDNQRGFFLMIYAFNSDKYKYLCIKTPLDAQRFEKLTAVNFSGIGGNSSSWSIRNWSNFSERKSQEEEFTTFKNYVSTLSNALKIMSTYLVLLGLSHPHPSRRPIGEDAAHLIASFLFQSPDAKEQARFQKIHQYAKGVVHLHSKGILTEHLLKTLTLFPPGPAPNPMESDGAPHTEQTAVTLRIRPG